MAAGPQFAAVPRVIDRATVATANTNRDGSGTIVSIASGSATGLRISSVVCQPTVTTSAGMIRLFVSTDSGTTWNLFDEIPVSATTVSASVPGARSERTYTNLVLSASTVRLGAATHNAESHQVFAMGADL